MSSQSDHNSPLGDKFKDFEYKPSNSLFGNIHNGLRADPDQGVLNDKFTDFEYSVSEGAWEKIEKELHPKKRRKAILWWSAASVFVIGIGLGIFGEFKSNDNEISQLNTNNLPNPIISSPKRIPLMSSTKKITKERVLDKQKQAFSKRRNNLVISQTSSQIKNESTGLLRGTKYYYEAISVDEKRISLHEQRFATIYKDSLSNLSSELLNGLENKNDDHRFVRHTLASVIGSFTGASGSFFEMDASDEFVNSSENALFSENFTSFDMPSSVSSDPFPSEGVVQSNEFHRARYKDYSAPTSFGFLYQRNLNKQFSIASGLIYTRIGYQYKNQSLSEFHEKGQEEYIAIPLNISFDLLKNSSFDLYPLIGAQVDFGLNGKDEFKFDGTDNGVTTIDKISPGNLYSVLTGVGSSYALTQKLSLFGQTVFQYYPSASQYSYYSNKPTNLSFQGGIKFSF